MLYFEDFSIIRLINAFRLVYTQHQLTYVARAIEGNILREERRKRGGRKVVCNPRILPVLNIGWGLSMGYRRPVLTVENNLLLSGKNYLGTVHMNYPNCQ